MIKRKEKLSFILLNNTIIVILTILAIIIALNIRFFVPGL